MAELRAAHCVVVADDRVAPLHADALVTCLQSESPTTLLTFPPGELSKSVAQWERLLNEMLDLRLGRDTVLVALGGGVTGDLAGFVAATLQRGIPWIQVPTTLLAMIDSSIGGKTGVDTRHGKNLIGAFHQPTAVFIDVEYLNTLPDEQMRAATAEALKHGVIADASYFGETVKNAQAVLSRDSEALTDLINRSLHIKAAVVSEDEREAGRRAILNFGHTVGHAVESASDFTLPHGECVAMGMVVETRIAETIGVAESGLTDQIVAGLQAFGLPTSIPELHASQLLSIMKQDKKNRDGDIRFALPAVLGSMAQETGGKWTFSVPDDVTKRAMTPTS